jgi:hypothetical protein
MLNKNYRPLSELKQVYRSVQSEKLKRDYDAKKAVKLLKKQGDSRHEI